MECKFFLKLCTDGTPPIGKIHPHRKITVTLEPVMQLRCPSRFRMSLRRSSYCSVTAKLLSILVREIQFQRRKENYFTKYQNLVQDFLLIDLVLKQLNLLVFESLLYQVSSHWSSQRNVSFDL